MARQPKAVIKRSSQRVKQNGTYKRKRGFRYHLKGTNGENLGASQFYTRKESAQSTLNKYFTNFKVVDETAA